MNKTIYTFWELLNECPIVIPQVQRDYAYGRDEEKAKSVCNNILSSIHDVLVPDSLEEAHMVPLTLDFVYGNIREEAGLSPLDGQQRLTTLFLLHLYATVKENRPEERYILRKFCYETRQSANNFCHNLIEDFALNTDSKKSLSKQILDSPKCLPTFKSDPTITSMMVVLDRIADKFADISDLWKKLTDERRIIFYFEPLSDFGLSDDLYIKMNSRGKSLTNYEIYKSDFLEFLEEKYPDLKKDFSEKLDTVWTDVIWKHAELDSNGKRSVRCVDDGFINLFNNVSVLLYHIRTDENFSDNGGKESKHLAAPFEEQFTCRKEIELLFSIFNLIEIALTDKDMCKYTDGLFYQSDSVLGDGSDNIRIFWRSKDNLFTIPFKNNRNGFTREQMILFYAVFLGIQNSLDYDVLKIRLRHLRNLVSHSQYELRGKNLHGMLTETFEYIVNGIFPSTTYFNTIQVNEENEKDKLSNWSVYWKYENHSILKGALGLFMKNSALDQLEKFSSLFDESYKENTTILRLAFLIAGEGKTDYYQYEKYMDPSDKKQKRRYLVNHPSTWADFFIQNNIRHNQDAIIEHLKDLPSSIEEINEYVSNGMKTLPTKSWKYYMVKYPWNSQTVADWTYGIYVWEDMETRPIEVIMLNSQVHSEKNLEWNILNLTLRNQEDIKDHCALDSHGGSPIKLERANSYISAKQEGWIVSTYEGRQLLEMLVEDENYDTDGSIIENDDGTVSTTVLVDDRTDYIEFGKKLIGKIESIFNNIHQGEVTEDLKEQ